MQEPCADALEISVPSLVPAIPRDRPHRFLLAAYPEGRAVPVAGDDPGRLECVLVPGAPVLLAPATTPGRRIGFTAVLAHAGRRWDSVQPGLANRIVQFAPARGRLTALYGVE